jgi:peptide/nickel transport system permease protein
MLAPHNPIKTSLGDRTAPPMWDEAGSSRFILGTDHVGRDILSRVIHGARVSLLVTAISLTSGLVVGTALGLIAGYFGGHIDELLMRLVEIELGMPFILIALVVVIVVGQSFAVLLGLLALLAWTPFARNVRAEVLSLKTRDYVAQARIVGASTTRILLVHILPGVLNTVLVIATLRVGQLILAEATLSFLGAGIPPPAASWGAMISDGRSYLNDAWWIAFFPGMCIFLVVMALNFLGDWMRDRFDPRLRQL